jgi:hypothetical protein
MPSPTEITVTQLSRLVGLPGSPVLIDVRTEQEFMSDPRLVPTAQRHPSIGVEGWCTRYAGNACRAGMPARLVLSVAHSRLCEGFQTPAHDDGCQVHRGRCRKASREEPARGVQCRRRGRYGDLAAAARAAVMGSRSGCYCLWLSASAIEVDAAPIAAGNGHDRGAECGVEHFIGRASSEPVADGPASSAMASDRTMALMTYRS